MQSAREGALAALNANLAARNLIVRGGPGSLPAIDDWQQIFNQTYTANVPGTVVTVPVKNVGLIKRFLVKVVVKVNAGATTLQTLGPLGPSAIFSNVTLFDYNNQQRINCNGWLLQLIASAKRRRVFGSSVVTDTPYGYGNNYALQRAAGTINAGGNATVTAYFEVPCSYTDHDLRGALYGNVTSSNAFLQLTINNNLFVSSTANALFALYSSGGTDLSAVDGTTGLTITVYQNFLDQLPRDQRGVPILPILDLGTAYVLSTTSTPLPVVSVDNSIPYANFRDFMSTSFIFDNANSRAAGTDINYIAIQSANYTNLLKWDPITATLIARGILGDDPPTGMYYLDHRYRPINSQQYGNMSLLINPSSIGGSTATFYVGYEMLALINAITQAGSLFAV